MALHSPARRGPVGQDEQAGDGAGRPAELIGGDLTSEAGLGVVASEGLLDRRELRLHLNHEQGLGGTVECQKVDRSALTPYRECDLRSDFPTEAAQPRSESTAKCRMAFIE